MTHSREQAWILWHVCCGGEKWIQDLPVVLCNPLPVWPVFQVLVSNGWFQSSAKPWRTSFQASYGSLPFVTTPILAPKSGSGQDWQNPSCCRDAKSQERDVLLHSILAAPLDCGVFSHRILNHFRAWILAVSVWSLRPGAKNLLLYFFITWKGK